VLSTPCACTKYRTGKSQTPISVDYALYAYDVSYRAEWVYRDTSPCTVHPVHVYDVSYREGCARLCIGNACCSRWEGQSASHGRRQVSDHTPLCDSHRKHTSYLTGRRPRRRPGPERLHRRQVQHARRLVPCGQPEAAVLSRGVAGEGVSLTDVAESAADLLQTRGLREDRREGTPSVAL
jgi:hypothetical protein